MANLRYELVFRGRDADGHQMNFYDVSHALWGFERTLSITTHFFLNGNVITQSPSAKGFQLLAEPPEKGSWKFVATVLGSIGIASQAGFDTPLGFLMKSGIDYVVNETLGFHPNFEDALGVQIDEYRRLNGADSLPKDMGQSRFDSVIEKSETGVRALHRPLVYSQSANSAQINCELSGQRYSVGPMLDVETYEYVSKTIKAEDFSEYCGNISSYNANTFRGRIYIEDENRTVPFELSEETRTARSIGRVVDSLGANAKDMSFGANSVADVCLTGIRNESVSGRLKSLYVTEVADGRVS